MRRLPPLTSLRAFEAAARHGSFKHAAEELALTATAISHQVRQLEARLGVRLFERRPRQVELTAAGRLLYPALRDGFDGMATALEALRTQAQRPRITLTATRAFVSRWLLPRLPALSAAAPGIDLYVHADDHAVDLAGGRADLAVRYGTGRWPGLASQRLFPGAFAPVCSPALGLRNRAALPRHALLEYEWTARDALTCDWPRWWREARLRGAPPAARARFGDETHALQAAVAGQGVVLASLAMVAEELAQGTLVLPFGPVLRGHDFHLAWVADEERARVHAPVREWLLAQGRRTARRLREARTSPAPAPTKARHARSGSKRGPQPQ